MSFVDTTAVILAAGNGNRLRGKKFGEPKPLVKLCGLSLAERSVAQLRAAGITRFVVVLGNEAEQVRAHFEKVFERRGCEGVFVLAPGWERGNGCSAAAAAPYVGDGPFILAMVDHLLSAEMIRRLLSSPPKDGEIALAVDTSDDSVFDTSDLTKVIVSEGKVVEIGKDLPRWNGGDTGLFYCSRLLFDGLSSAMNDGRYSLTDGVRHCARIGSVRAVDVTGCFWMDVDTPEAYAEARRRLAAGLSKGKADGFISQYLNRPLSRRLSMLLADTPVTPNQITLAGFALALLGALCLGTTRAASWVAGGVLIQLASVLDGCDGEVARLKHLRSARGAWLDTVLDRYADVAIGAAIILGASHGSPSPLVLLLGLVSVSSFLLASYVTKEHEIRLGRPYPDNALSRLKKRDLRILSLALGAAAGRPLAALVAVGLLTHLAVAAIMVHGWSSVGAAAAAPRASSVRTGSLCT